MVNCVTLLSVWILSLSFVDPHCFNFSASMCFISRHNKRHHHYMGFPHKQVLLKICKNFRAGSKFYMYIKNALSLLLCVEKSTKYTKISGLIQDQIYPACTSKCMHLPSYHLSKKYKMCKDFGARLKSKFPSAYTSKIHLFCACVRLFRKHGCVHSCPLQGPPCQAVSRAHWDNLNIWISGYSKYFTTKLITF